LGIALKLAIIGSGIGGCSAAYFAQTFFSENIEITIYETEDRLGGRLLARKVGPVMNELGATFFHTVNQNLQTFVKELSLDIEEYTFPTMGVWNGSQFVFKSSRSSFLTNIRMFLRYRLSTLKLLSLVKKVKKEVLKLYENSRFDQEYNSIEDLLGVSFIRELMSKSLDNVLIEAGVSEKLIRELLEPGVRLIYCQNIKIGGFAGIATIVAFDGTPLHKIRDGNVTLAQKLVEAAKATIKLNHKILRVKKNENGTFLVESQVGTKNEYDAVILAAPFEQLGIEFENIQIPAMEPRNFQKVFIKLITGLVDPKFFGLNRIDDVPEMLMTTSDFKGHFNNLENLGETEQGDFVYNLIATKPISNELVKKMFSKHSIIDDVIWDYAYPVSKPATSFQPFILDDKLFYINTMESAASTMEASILGARNVINLLKREINEKLS
jgi:prenylcysteine oxidase/farnesylcysteine lyase